MALVKIKVPVFADAVRIHKPDDIVELGVDEAKKYERRGWGDPYTAPKTEARKAEGKQEEGKK